MSKTPPPLSTPADIDPALDELAAPMVPEPPVVSDEPLPVPPAPPSRKPPVVKPFGDRVQATLDDTLGQPVTHDLLNDVRDRLAGLEDVKSVVVKRNGQNLHAQVMHADDLYHVDVGDLIKVNKQ